MLISYCAQALYATQQETADLRGIRMDASERFAPEDYPLGRDESERLPKSPFL